MDRYYIDSQGNPYCGDRQGDDKSITEAEVVALKKAKADAELAEAEAKLTYADKRAREYPPDVDQLDMLWHDIDDGLLGETAKTSSFYKARKAVKDKYPKE